jgi:hypothetical protein
MIWQIDEFLLDVCVKLFYNDRNPPIFYPKFVVTIKSEFYLKNRTKAHKKFT